MRGVIGLLLCAALGCSCFKTFIFKDPRVVETPRVFVECKICNTTNPFILNRYSAIEEEALKTCKYLYNGIKECPPNTRIYYNKVCDREECYLGRGDECEETLNFSYRGIECEPGVACDQHSDGKHRCGSELYRNVKIRRNGDTPKGLPLALRLDDASRSLPFALRLDDASKSLPLALRIPRVYEELAMRYGSSDEI